MMGEKIITFSFDDGNEADAKLIELLNKYDFRCTVNLNTGVSPDAVWYCNQRPIRRLPKSAWSSLFAGHEIAAHTHTHLTLDQLGEEQIFAELSQNKEELEQHFGKEVVGLAYPYGAYDRRVTECAKKIGFQYGRGTKSTHRFCLADEMLEYQATCHVLDNCIFDSVERFAREEEGKRIFCIWGHSYDLDVWNKWNYFEDLLRRLRDTGAARLTNREAFGI